LQVLSGHSGTPESSLNALAAVRAYFSTNARDMGVRCCSCEDPIVRVGYECRECQEYALCHKCYFDHAHAETEHSFNLHFAKGEEVEEEEEEGEDGEKKEEEEEEEEEEVGSLRVVPAHAQGQEEEDEFTFVWWDVDGDGKISLQDLQTSTVLRLNFSAKVVEALFTHLLSLDASQGTFVSKEVFVLKPKPQTLNHTPNSKR
jgi:hypothetical protein